jgi:hypothetical protein
VSEKPLDEDTIILDRALPTSLIDLLIFGLQGNQKPKAKKVYGAFVSIAMSAQLRGWTRIQFLDEVVSRKSLNINGVRQRRHHRLWTQLEELSRDDGHATKSLDRAWEQAKANLSDSTMRTPEDIKATAIETAYGWHDRLLAGTDGLNDTGILVMDYVIQETERRQMTRVTCPARVVAEHAKVSPMVALRTLKKLTAQGLLVQHSPGKGGSNPSRRRAAIYSLTDPEEPSA